MSGPYDDIIQLPHPTSARHPRMSFQNVRHNFHPLPLSPAIVLHFPKQHG